jgi:hypothetical protein
MKLINNILYIEWSEMAAAGISENTMRSAKLNQSAAWSFISDPRDKRKVLIEFNALKPEYKKAVEAKYGNPLSYQAAQLIDTYLVTPSADAEAMAKYKLADGTSLPIEHRAKYETACAYLHLLSTTTCKSAKAMGLPNLDTFTSAMIQLIEARGIALPASYSKLKAKVREYQKQGATCVVSKRFCNKNREKISEQGLAYIKELFGYGNGFSLERVTMEYNLHATTQQWQPLTASAVRYNLMKTGLLQEHSFGRENEGKWRDKFDISVSRMRPSRPGMLWVGDGTPFELYYQTNIDGKRNYWCRKYVYVVIDAYNDCVMGFAIGETEDTDLAKRAWYNACINTMVAPDQIKTDNFGSKELRSSYSALAKTPAHFTPASVGNARDKVVEQFFAKIFEACAKDYLSYAGSNITAKNQPNRDLLNSLKHEFPTEEQVIEQIVDCMAKWNTMPRKKLNGESLLQQWQQGNHTQLRSFSDDLRLEVFGKLHSDTNRLTKEGLRPTLQGVTYEYLLLTDAFADTIGMEYQVVYDPFDLSSIMAVAKGGRYKFVVPQKTTIPMAMGDFKAGDREKLNNLLDFKKHRKQLVVQRKATNRQLADAEGLMRLFPVIKGTNKNVINESEDAYKQLSTEAFAEAVVIEEQLPLQKLQQSHWYDDDNDID